MAGEVSSDLQAEMEAAKRSLELGVASLRRRDFGGAAEHFRGVLQRYPEHAEALNLLGCSIAWQGDLAKAIELIRRAVALRPDNAAFRGNLGNCYIKRGENDAALAEFEAALRLAPGDAAASAGVGPILVERGLVSQAIAVYRQAIARNPGNAVLHYFLGAAYQAAGEPGREIASLRKAIEINPGFVEARTALAAALRFTGELGESSTLFGQVAGLVPNSADAICNYALSLFLLNRREAMHFFEKALQLDPNVDSPYLRAELARFEEAIRREPANAASYNSLGMLHRMLRRWEESITQLRRAAVLAPGNVFILNNLGATLSDVGKYDEALDALNKALETDPGYVHTYNHLGAVYGFKGVHEQAAHFYRRALEMDPALIGCRWNFARSLLASGQFEEGWEEFECRLDPSMSLRSELTEPYWDGAVDRAKTVLLTTEGGAGDAIQFIRLVRGLRERVGRFILRCPAELAGLLRTVGGIDEVVVKGTTLPHFDAQIPLQSLARIAKVRLDSVPNKVPYLVPEAERVTYWADRLKKLKGIKVGIAWCGSLHLEEDMRSRTLAVFAPLARIEGVTFVSLQKIPTANEATPTGLELVNFTAELNDFAESAAVVQNLDLVITVDTSTAHLAGALGRAVWVLIPFIFDFRWLVGRTDSPWYPTMRLFRQKVVREWGPVVDEMGGALRSFVSERAGAAAL
jgi:tetratricopeptide (TPR) repeat protein